MQPGAPHDGPPELDVERTVAGGAGLAREPEGRVVLVDGALPTERVTVRITSSKPRMATAVLDRVLVAAQGRVEPPCPELHAGCGGCDLQHAAGALQRELKVGIVRDALRRIGRLGDVRVDPGEFLATEDHRTVLRCGVVDGRAALHRRRSSELHPIRRCLVAHPLVEEILAEGSFDGAAEVLIRVGARTGERLVALDADADPEQVRVPAGVHVVVGDAPGHIHEVVARRRFRISARSFFQARPDGAEALVRAVDRAVGGFDAATDRLGDLYGGVGLFSGALGARHGVLVERSESAASDAEVNLAGSGLEVVSADVRRWTPQPVGVVVADPARAGLGRDGVRAVLGAAPERIAMVSCDPASLARDARALVDAGYEVLGVELVDMFPHTHHVEAVTALRRTRAA